MRQSRLEPNGLVKSVEELPEPLKRAYFSEEAATNWEHGREFTPTEASSCLDALSDLLHDRYISKRLYPSVSHPSSGCISAKAVEAVSDSLGEANGVDPTCISVSNKGQIAIGTTAGFCYVVSASFDHIFQVGKGAAGYEPVTSVAWCKEVGGCINNQNKKSKLQRFPMLAIGRSDGSLALVEPGKAAPLKELKEGYTSRIITIGAAHLNNSSIEVIAGDESGTVKHHSLYPVGVVVRHRCSSLGSRVFAHGTSVFLEPDGNFALFALATNSSVAVLSVAKDVKLLGRPGPPKTSEEHQEQSSQSPDGSKHETERELPYCCWICSAETDAHGLGWSASESEWCLISAWGKSLVVHSVSSRHLAQANVLHMDNRIVGVQHLQGNYVVVATETGSIVTLEPGGVEVDRVELGQPLVSRKVDVPPQRHAPSSTSTTATCSCHASLGSSNGLACALVGRSVIAIQSELHKGSSRESESGAIERIGGMKRAVEGLGREGWDDAGGIEAGIKGMAESVLREGYLERINTDRSNSDEVLISLAVACVATYSAMGCDDRAFERLFGMFSQIAGSSAVKAMSSALWAHAGDRVLGSPELVRALASTLREEGKRESLAKLFVCANIECIDFDQALRACKDLELLTASARITSEALGDFASPFSEMLSAAEASLNRDSSSGAIQEGKGLPSPLLKFLLYFRQCCNGRRYPPGKGDLAPQWASRARQTAAEFFFDSNGESPSHALRVAMMSADGIGSIVVLDGIARCFQHGDASVIQMAVDALMRLVQEWEESCCLEASRAVAELVCRFDGLSWTDEGAELLVKSLAKAKDEMTLATLALCGRGKSLAKEVEGAARSFDLADVRAAVLSMRGEFSEAIRELARSSDPFGFADALLDPKWRLRAIRQGVSLPPAARLCEASDEAEKNRFREALVANLPCLAEANLDRAARIAVEHLGADPERALDSLGNDKRLQFEFLKRVISLKGVDEGGLLGSKGQTMFAELQCEFEAGAVKRFLETAKYYDVRSCLDACRRHRVDDATAFLLERVGDSERALEIHLHLLAQRQEDVKAFPSDVKADETALAQLKEAIGVCSRNGWQEDRQQGHRTLLWFTLLDRCVQSVKDLAPESQAAPKLEFHLRQALSGSPICIVL